jgi:cytochrome c peroxidase
MIENQPRYAAAFRLRGLGLATLAAAVALSSSACGDERPLQPDPDPDPVDFDWDLPAGFPTPRVPEDDPMTAEQVALGRHLFYDERMSGNETMSCASCHAQALAFTDARPLAVGSTGDVLPRSSMSLTNIAYSPVLTWGDHRQTALTEQMLIPMFAPDPVELGLAGEEALLDRLRADGTYPSLFAEAYPEDSDPFTLDNVTRAVAAFERVLISGDSPEDRFRRGDANAMSASAQDGRSLFFSDEVGCFECHSGENLQDEVVFFTSNFDFEGRSLPHIQFDNTGLYNLIVNGETGWYPEPNTGLYAITGNPLDIGQFTVPDLRNVALTAPAQHDGSIATLDEVIDHYAAGGRTIAIGPYAGVGSDNPHKSRLVAGFTLTADQRTALIDYLGALTDQAFITDSRFSNPWPPGSPAHGAP